MLQLFKATVKEAEMQMALLRCNIYHYTVTDTMS